MPALSPVDCWTREESRASKTRLRVVGSVFESNNETFGPSPKSGLLPIVAFAIIILTVNLMKEVLIW